MPRDYLDELTLDDLQSEEQYAIAECIGMDAYIKLVRHFAGSALNIPMPWRLSLKIRNAEIIASFSGHNYKLLAERYQLCESSIRYIVKKQC